MFKRRRRNRQDEADAVDESGADAVDEVPAIGPFDVDDAPDDDVARLDLGSMRVPTPSGVEARMQTDDKGNVKQVVLVQGESVLQLGVFAAPRSEGIWEEVRAELVSSIADQGGKAEEVADGEYGIELVVQPAGGKDPAARFIGIDGPRWFIRGLFQGKRAVDPDAAPLLDEALRGVVVDRGTQAMPVREGLPLRLPAKMAEEAAKARLAKSAAAKTVKQANGAGGTKRAAGRRKPSPKPKKR